VSEKWRWAKERKKMYRLSTVVALMLILSQMSCKRGPVEPGLKNPREYSWTIDTLAYPGSIQTLMGSLWASSPTDVYAVGHNDVGPGTMYHFDGHVWRAIDPALSIGTVEQAFGFASNDVWAVGEHITYNPKPPPTFLDSSLAIHFNGTKWQEIDLERSGGLLSVWGSAPTDVWMGGLNGTLFHFNGISVQKDSLPILIPVDQETPYGIYSIAGSSQDDVYLLLYAPMPSGLSRNYLFQHKKEGWVAVDSTFGSFARIWMSPSGKLYSVGYGVYAREGAKWVQVLDTWFTSNGICGPGDGDLFVVGGYESSTGISGVVYHFDGVDWFQFKDLSLDDVGYTGVWTDGKEVFIVGQTIGGYPQKTIILHGQ
jgi:hypothetical protein